MTTIKVKLRPSSVLGKAGTIVYQIIHLRKTRLLTTDIHLTPDCWDALNEQVTGNQPETLQVRINNGIKLLQRIIGKLEKSGKPYSCDEVARRFRSMKPEFSFLEFMENEIRLLTEIGKSGTAHNYQSTLNSLTTFLNGRELTFGDFTETLVYEYNIWLFRHRLSRNAISFYMRVLRAVYNKAVKRQATEQTFPFRNVYTGVERTRKRAVNEGIISRLFRLELPSCSPLSLARDLFIFSYCTRGMAFVDMAFLRKTDIRNGTICYTRRKTDQQLEVKLENITENIINKYTALTPNIPYIFPLLKTQEETTAYRQYRTQLRYYNRLLKRLSSMLGTETELSSYIARHSWATAARNHNIPLSVISAGMGHTSEKTTRIYLASLENYVIDNANYEIIRNLSNAL